MTLASRTLGILFLLVGVVCDERVQRGEELGPTGERALQLVICRHLPADGVRISIQGEVEVQLPSAHAAKMARRTARRIVGATTIISVGGGLEWLAWGGRRSAGYWSGSTSSTPSMS